MKEMHKTTSYIASDFLACVSKHSTISLKPQENIKKITKKHYKLLNYNCHWQSRVSWLKS